MNKRFLAALLLTAGLAWAEGDVARGQIFYAHLLGKELGYNGAVFAKQQTAAQWERLFEKEGAEFVRIYGPQMKGEGRALIESEHFKTRILPHLAAFAIFYAKDRPETPVCESAGAF